MTPALQAAMLARYRDACDSSRLLDIYANGIDQSRLAVTPLKCIARRWRLANAGCFMGVHLDRVLKIVIIIM